MQTSKGGKFNLPYNQGGLPSFDIRRPRDVMRLVENLLIGFIALAPVAFAGVGVALIWFSYISPARQQSAAIDWIETPCTIESIKIKVTPSTRNWPEHRTMRVAYQYQMAGRSYESTRYQFHGDGFGEFEETDALYVEEHPAGSTTVCYVDPKDHSSAVLWHQRKLGFGMAFLASLFLCGSILLAKVMWGLSFGWIANLLPSNTKQVADSSHGGQTRKKRAAETDSRRRPPKRKRRKNYP